MTEAFIQRGPFSSRRSFAHAFGSRQGAQPRPFHSIGVVGAGPLGSAVTASLLDAGIPVTLKESSHELLDEGLSRLEAYLRDLVTDGWLTPAECEARMDLLSPTCWYVAMSSVDIVIDCSEEKPIERTHAIEALDRVMKAGAILATNAVATDLEHLARCTRRQSDVIGVRFSHPAEEVRLMEISKGERTCEEAVATIVSLATAMNRIPVVGCVS